MSKIKVVFEASVLGVGYYHQTGRTGVFRVVENLLKHLNASKKIELSIFAVNNLAETITILEKEYNISDASFANDKCDKWLSVFENSLQKPFPKGSFVQKAIRGLIGRIKFYTLPFENTLKVKLQANEVFIYHSPFTPLPAYLKANKNSISVLTIHDLIPKIHPEFFNEGHLTMNQRLWDSIDTSTTVICVSNATKNDVCQHLNVDAAKVHVIPLAADKSRFYKVYSPAIVERTLVKYHIKQAGYFLSVATLEPRKNITTTVKSFGAFLAQNPDSDLELVLVGSKGWFFEEIFKEVAANEKLKSRIIVTGFVPDEDLAALYSAAKAFIYPSLYEGFGLPVLEAMQCGVAVVSSNKSSIPEVVGEAGILIEPTDEKALTAALQALASNSELVAELGQKAIKQAALFSWEKCAEQHIELYESLTNKK